jgi:SAM-dependent methyltransferase
VDVRRSVLAACRWVVRRARRNIFVALNRATDGLLGIRTSEQVTLEELGFARGNLGRYQPTSWLRVVRALRSLNPGRDDVVVDLGCGRGRALFAAMSMPFRRVIGVELSPRLADEARVATARRRFWMRAGGVEVIAADAAGWPLPDEVTIVYMYNPFWGPVFTAAVDNILASVDRRPRRLRVVYDYPFEHNYLLSTGRFVPVSVIGPRRKANDELTNDVVIYEVLSSARDPVPVGPVGAWAGMRDTSAMLSGFQPLITPARG